MICCPYHNDNSPSATVSMDASERRVPLGFMGCFGCKKHVGWNTLANYLHLQPFQKKEDLTSDDYNTDTEELKSDLFEEDIEDSDDIYEKWEDLKDLKFHKDFPFDEWRGVDVDLLRRVGAKLCEHREYKKFWVWIPVNVDGVLRGYIRATMDKAKNGKSSYLNAKGGWARNWGLIYYDYAVKLMKKRRIKTLVLCEGPRDSLRFLSRGIPATSVLGALNWSAAKRSLLEDAGVEKLILAFDGDKAGWTACRHVYSDTRKFFNTKYLALWNTSPAWDPVRKRFPSDLKIKELKEEYKDHGIRWEELDPFNMPEFYVDCIEEILE